MSLFTLGTLVKGINASAVTLATEPLGTSNTLDPVRSTGLHKGDGTACTGVVFITWRRRTWRIFFISRAATLSSSASASYSSSPPSRSSSLSPSTDWSIAISLACYTLRQQEIPRIRLVCIWVQQLPSYKRVTELVRVYNGTSTSQPISIYNKALW